MKLVKHNINSMKYSYARKKINNGNLYLHMVVLAAVSLWEMVQCTLNI